MPTLSDKMKQIYLALSAATGGLIAVLSDVMQKGDASAVEHLATVLRIPSYMWLAALMLIALAVALSFIYGAHSYKTAFTTGAGTLALMVTLTPYKALPSLECSSSSNEVNASENLGWFDRLVIPSRVFAQTSSSPADTVTYSVHLDPTDKKPIDTATFTLVDPSSGLAIRRSRVTGSDLKFSVNNQPYRLRVLVDGYQIAEVDLNPSTRNVVVPLTPSSIPISLQRLFHK